MNSERKYRVPIMSRAQIWKILMNTHLIASNLYFGRLMPILQNIHHQKTNLLYQINQGGKLRLSMPSLFVSWIGRTNSTHFHGSHCS